MKFIKDAEVFINGTSCSNELIYPSCNIKPFPISTHESHIDETDVDAVMFHPVLRARNLALYVSFSIDLGTTYGISCLVSDASWHFSPAWFH
jgi:hypothetical protein